MTNPLCSKNSQTHLLMTLRISLREIEKKRTESSSKVNGMTIMEILPQNKHLKRNAYGRQKYLVVESH